MVEFGILPFELEPILGEKSSTTRVGTGRLSTSAEAVVSEVGLLLLVTALIHSAIRSILASASWHR